MRLAGCGSMCTTCPGAGNVDGGYSGEALMFTKHHLLGLVLALIAGILLLGAACSGGDDGDDGPADTSATPTFAADDVRALCNVITQSDVESILETEVSKTSALRHPDGVSCSWFIDYTLDGLDDGGPVNVRFYTEGGRAAFDTVQATYDTEDVAGLGDAAYHAPDVFSLYVLTGDDTAFFVLDATYARAWTPPESWAEDLAAAVLDRLP